MVFFFSACTLFQLSKDELIGMWGENRNFPSAKGVKECAFIEFFPSGKFVAYNLPIRYFGEDTLPPTIRVKRVFGTWILHIEDFHILDLNFKTEGFVDSGLPIIDWFPPEFFTWAGADESDMLRFTKNKNEWCNESP
jgi:hypothetical protein